MNEQPEPVTKEDVRWSLFVRNKIVEITELDKDVSQRLREAKVYVWNEYSLKAAYGEGVGSDEYVDWLVEKGLVSNVDGEQLIEITPPYFDSIHILTKMRFGRGFFHGDSPYGAYFGFWFKWDDEFTLTYGEIFCPAIEGEEKIEIDEHGQAKVETYLTTRKMYAGKDDASTSALCFILLRNYIDSKYSHIDKAKARPEGRKSVYKKKRPEKEEVLIVVARRPEKVAQAERDRIHASGKSWELQYATPVNGHFRNQWYASLGTHKKIFVPGFVKAKDKPKDPRQRVVKVHR